MYKLSPKSLAQYETLDNRLKALVDELLQSSTHDFTIVQGHRTIQEEKRNFLTGKSKTVFSRHLLSPSLAVDMYPYVDGRFVNDNRTNQDKLIWNAFIDDITKAATKLNISINQGAKWPHFPDYAHTELKYKTSEIKWPEEVNELHDELFHNHS